MEKQEAIELVLDIFHDRPSGPSGVDVLRSLGVQTPFDEAVSKAAAEFRQELADAVGGHDTPPQK